MRCKSLAKTVAFCFMLGAMGLAGCQAETAEQKAKTREQQVEEDKARQQREVDEVRNAG